MATRASRLETLYLKLKMDVGTSAVRRGHLLVLHNNAYVILYLKTRQVFDVFHRWWAGERLTEDAGGFCRRI
jgi:hypothetical protein